RVGTRVCAGAALRCGARRPAGQLSFTRPPAGFGESSYAPRAPAMVSGLSPKARRGLVNGLFNAAIPLGGGTGVIVGGVIGSRYGWRGAFLLGGGPRPVVALLARRARRPPRGGPGILAAAGPLGVAPDARRG